jgi:hypothetical protein
MTRGLLVDDLPEETFVRVSRSEVIHLALATGTEWKARGETTVFFVEGENPHG